MFHMSTSFDFGKHENLFLIGKGETNLVQTTKRKDNGPRSPQKVSYLSIKVTNDKRYQLTA